MKTYCIKLAFTNPYIGSRNGGNKIVADGLSLRDAKNKLLDLFNDLTDYYALDWQEAKKLTKDKFDRASGSHSKQRFEYDSRIYSIEKEC